MTTLSERFNLTFDEVWSFGAALQPDYPYSITICTTINLAFIKAPQQGMLEVWINSSNSQSFYLEKHESGQSSFNYQLSYLEGFNVLHKSEAYAEIPLRTDVLSLKKSTFDCYEDNSMQKTRCVNQYIADQLGCSLPWYNETNFDNCEGKQKLEQFRNLSFYITSKNLKDCLKPNCKRSHWDRTAFTEKQKLDKTLPLLAIFTEHGAKVLKREEIKLADFSTFIADCGSYFGLFLGASVLSLTDLFLLYLMKIRDWFMK